MIQIHFGFIFRCRISWVLGGDLRKDSVLAKGFFKDEIVCQFHFEYKPQKKSDEFLRNETFSNALFMLTFTSVAVKKKPLVRRTK